MNESVTEKKPNKADKKTLESKKITSKAVKKTLESLTEKYKKQIDKIAELKKESSDLAKEIKQKKKLLDDLRIEEWKSEIAQICVKEKNLTDEQLLKLLELSTRIGDKVDLLDISKIESMLNIEENQPKAKETNTSVEKNKHENTGRNES